MTDPLTHVGAAVHGRDSDPADASGDRAPLELVPLPPALVLSEPGNGPLDLGHSGDLCWRIEPGATAPIREALSTALASQGAPDLGTWDDSGTLPRLPARMGIFSGADGTLLVCVDPPDATTYELAPEIAAPVRRALAAAAEIRAKRLTVYPWRTAV